MILDIKQALKKILPHFFLLFFLFFFGCSAKDSSTDRKTITGTIYVTGNVPFSRLTLNADNDSTYFLKCDNKIDSLLYSNQGTKVVIKYQNIIDSAGTKILNVLEARFPASD